MNWKVVSLLVLSVFVLTAGCSSIDDPSNETDIESPESNTETAPLDNNEQEQDNEQEDQREDPTHPLNPYDSDTLIVSVNDSEADRNKTETVSESLKYWSNNSGKYAGYPIKYDLRPNATDPDVAIVWEDDIQTCGLNYSADFVGCADIVEGTAPDTVEVRMETGWIEEDEQETLKHELGHTLGLTHDDKPEDIMSGYVNSTALETHVNVRILWKTDSHDRDEVRSQVENALDYYEEWSRENMKTNVTYSILDSGMNIHGDDGFDIVISDERDYCDDEESPTCLDHGNKSLNENYAVALADMPEESTAWFVGSYFGHFLHLEEDELPEPIQDTDTENVLSEWWAEYSA